MTAISDFAVGDRVRHISMDERGTVEGVDFEVRVKYDRTNERGQHWMGTYDENWFRIHPDLLRKTNT